MSYFHDRIVQSEVACAFGMVVRCQSALWSTYARQRCLERITPLAVEQVGLYLILSFRCRYSYLVLL